MCFLCLLWVLIYQKLHCVLSAQPSFKHGNHNNGNNNDKETRCLLCLGWTPFFSLIHSSPLFVFTFLSLRWIYLAGQKQKILLPCLNRAALCFCRRGDLRHARSTSCDAPSASQWRHTFQNSTASCPPRAVSSPRTQLCSDHSAHIHTHTHIQTRSPKERHEVFP